MATANDNAHRAGQRLGLFLLAGGVIGGWLFLVRGLVRMVTGD